MTTLAPYYSDDSVALIHGDCLDVLRTLPDASVDSVVTDPPYGLEFMGKEWDTHATPAEFQAWCELWARECLRVVKPGGHLLAFGGTRTSHRLACAIEDAGFEIRDSIAWLYATGFPKSLDVSKAIDAGAKVNDETKRRIALVAEVIRTHREAKGMERAAVSLAVVGTPSGACWNWEHQQLPSVEMWPAIKRVLDIPDEFDGLIVGDRAQFIAAERAVIGQRTTGIGTGRGAVAYIADGGCDTAPATPDAERWQGWGTAMKPAHEPVVCARKPFSHVSYEWRMVATVHHALGESTAPAVAAALASIAESLSSDLAAGSSAGSPATTSIATKTASGTSARTEGSSSAHEPVVVARKPLNAPGVNVLEMVESGIRNAGIEGEIRWTTNSAAKDSQTATESFAGIATGLTGSWATVRIDRLEDGSFVWPDGLPRKTGGGGTVAANILAHGTGALNVDGCRIDSSEAWAGNRAPSTSANGFGPGDADGWTGNWTKRSESNPAGRWPANVVLDESQATALDEQSGSTQSRIGSPRGADSGDGWGMTATGAEYDDIGGASRFFLTVPIDDLDARFTYVPKAGSDERPTHNGTSHATVKPLALMRWLVRLVTPPGGTVLEPFAGSGTTAEACLLERFHCIAIEREADYLPLIVQRINRRRDPIAYLTDAGHDLGLFADEEG